MPGVTLVANSIDESTFYQIASKREGQSKIQRLLDELAAHYQTSSSFDSWGALWYSNIRYSDPGGSRARGRARARAEHPTWAYRVWYRELGPIGMFRRKSLSALRSYGRNSYTQPCLYLRVPAARLRVYLYVTVCILV